MISVLQHIRNHPWWASALALALLAGGALRLVWKHDIEYKGDERWMFRMTQRIGKSQSLPWLGMPTSSVFLNPGFNVWVFWGLAEIVRAVDPPMLARGVQLGSLMALLIYAVFVWRCVPSHEQEPWWWALALMALSPMAVVFHRKIWQPSLFPLFTAVWLIGWWRRDRWWGASLWGLLGALLGQVQLAGAFFAAGFVGWAALFDRSQARWRWWLVGSAIGVIPFVPWFWYMLHRQPEEAIRTAGVGHWLGCNFWIRWGAEAFSFSTHYVLRGDFTDFLRYPLWAGQSTYLVAAAHGIVAGVAFLFFLRICVKQWRERDQLRTWFVDRASPTAFTYQAAMWGFGSCMTVSLLPIHRHYLIVAMPLVYLWLARQVLLTWRPSAARSLLLALGVANAFIAFQFLNYVHVHAATLHGGFGTPYSAQMRQSRLRPNEIAAP